MNSPFLLHVKCSAALASVTSFLFSFGKGTCSPCTAPTRREPTGCWQGSLGDSQHPRSAQEPRWHQRHRATQTPGARGARGGAPAAVPAPQRGAEGPRPGPQGHLVGSARARGAVMV